MSSFDRKKLISMIDNIKVEEESKGFKTDERLWSPEKQEEGKTLSARIRVLPLITNTKVSYPTPWVGFRMHLFKSPVTGKWVVEKCPTTINQPCAICDYSGKLFNSGDPDDATVAKKYYRQQKYVTNILVVKEFNEKRKENEGKVFMYEHGKKIHEKFKFALFPEGDQERILFLDPEQGFDFSLVVKEVSKFANYDASEFVRTSTPIASTDKAIGEILDNTYDIYKEYLAPSNFKSYAQLQEVVDTQIRGLASSDRKETSTSKPTETAPTSSKSTGMNTEEESFLSGLEDDLAKELGL